MKKTVYLVVALLLPGMIYVFLKYFGKNQFDVPIYYQQHAPVAPDGCHWSYAVPYSIPDTILRQLGGTGNSVTLFHDGGDETSRSIERLEGELRNDFQAIPLGLADSVFRSCILLMNDSFSVVVLDGEGRIRGYYHPVTREETDRLTVEMKILLDQY